MLSESNRIIPNNSEIKRSSRETIDTTSVEVAKPTRKLMLFINDGSFLELSLSEEELDFDTILYQLKRNKFFTAESIPFMLQASMINGFQITTGEELKPDDGDKDNIKVARILLSDQTACVIPMDGELLPLSDLEETLSQNPMDADGVTPLFLKFELHQMAFKKSAIVGFSYANSKPLNIPYVMSRKQREMNDMTQTIQLAMQPYMQALSPILQGMQPTSSELMESDEHPDNDVEAIVKPEENGHKKNISFE